MPDSKPLNTSTNEICYSQPSSPVQSGSEDIIISLNEIQRDEEQKLRKAINPKIKPLHILNVCNILFYYLFIYKYEIMT